MAMTGSVRARFSGGEAIVRPLTAQELQRLREARVEAAIKKIAGTSGESRVGAVVHMTDLIRKAGGIQTATKQYDADPLSAYEPADLVAAAVVKTSAPIDGADDIERVARVILRVSTHG
jgi:hypothetical protein